MIFIHGNVPSSKNGTVKSKNGIFHSKQVRKYLQYHGIKGFSSRKKHVEHYVRRSCTFPFESLKNELKTDVYPVIVGFHFVRIDRRQADFQNLIQILCDLFTAGGVIPDDNMSVFFPTPLLIDDKYYSIDKERPGVWISQVLKNE